MGAGDSGGEHPPGLNGVAPPKPSPRALGLSFTHRLHTLHKLTDRVSQAAYLADAGLPLSEGRCLAAVGAFAPLSVNDLARHANLDKAQASRAVQVLVDQGLVRKQASPTDGRGVVLTLTAAGRRAWQRVMEVISRRNDEILACLDARECQTLSELLDRLVTHAREGAGMAGESGEADGAGETGKSARSAGSAKSASSARSAK
jgi:DNA-binding MarR family transcriptional regulator